MAYFLFNSYFNDQQKYPPFVGAKRESKLGLPLRLQAYERLVLFLERISPNKLLLRVPPLSDDKMDYVNLLIHHIEQEFDHNLTQQIYVSNEGWMMIITAKNTVIQNLRKTAIGTDITNADELRQRILSNQFEVESSATIALSYFKNGSYHIFIIIISV